MLVSSGGIGRPIDELMLNQALFEKHGVEVVGAVINKVQADRLERIRDYLERGLARLGMSLLGVIPERKALSDATVRQIRDEIKAELIGGEGGLERIVQKIVVGAMTPHRAMDFFSHNTLVITPGDREDIMLAAMSSCAVGTSKAYCVAGICLTGGIRPHKTVLRLIRRADIPVMLVPEDTYSVASRIADLVFKITPADAKKVRIASRLVKEYVDLDLLMARLS
jgi:BioD-like phosphotransacetylase family protein